MEAAVAAIDGGGGGASRSRAAVLDRWAQHTAVCPDSRVAWRNLTVLAWVRPRECPLIVSPRHQQRPSDFPLAISLNSKGIDG